MKTVSVRNLFMALACAVVGVAAAPAGIAQQAQAAGQPNRAGLSHEEVVQIEKEVTQALQTYYRLYSERNYKSIGPDVYLDRWISFGKDGPALSDTTDPVALQKRFAGNVQRLESSMNWDKSEYPAPIVCVVNAVAAIASGEAVRYDKNGKVVDNNPITYIFGKTKDGWRVVTFFSHEHGKVVGCNDGD